MAKGIDNMSDASPRSPSQVKMQPSAPPVEQQPLFGDNCVTFLLNGIDQISVDRSCIASNSPILQTIITDTRPNSNGSFRIDNRTMEARDFEAVLKFFENKFIKFQDLDDTLRKFEIAKEYACYHLIVRCVRDIDSRLSTSNVIKVFRSVRYYVSAETPDKKPSNTGSSQQKTMEQALAELVYNVLQFIDMNADVVLQRDEIIDARLSFTEIEMIVRRDGLQTTESVLYNLLAKWSRIEAERRNFDLTAENKRRVLGALCYVPR